MQGQFNFRNRQIDRSFKDNNVKSMPQIQGKVGKQLAIGQLELTMHSERRIRRIVRSQQSQTLAKITAQLNDGASGTVSKQAVQRWLHRMCFRSRGPSRVSLFNARHRAARLAWAREHKD
ncbi:HTH_Tnp_Tc3_2 domain-containing protein [Trichonephila clavipes]|nr:HTH_Tnp_Tc3_2 domain-containing protein [Trichonephila clavipes]